jgi:hypothetical protein
MFSTILSTLSLDQTVLANNKDQMQMREDKYLESVLLTIPKYYSLNTTFNKIAARYDQYSGIYIKYGANPWCFKYFATP